MIKAKTSIKQCVIQLVFDRQLHHSVKSHQLRGAIAALCPGNILFHQHEPDGRTVYSYPLIQYKVINTNAMLVGLDAGAEALAQLHMLDVALDIGKETYQVARQEISFSTVEFGWHLPHLLYEFFTPWLALNDKNYMLYQRTGDIHRKKQLLISILTGNLLAMSKGLGYRVNFPIEADIFEFREIQTRLKGIPMTAFKGIFCANFNIPQWWGLGKSASRGFGTVQKKYIS